MPEGEPRPWERPGYGYGGPIDPLHSTKLNSRWLEETRDAPPAPNGDIAASVVVFARGEGDILVMNLLDSSEISSDDFELVRQQHAHLR